jgi:hypothetical protein
MKNLIPLTLSQFASLNMQHTIISAMIFLGIVFGAIECFFGYRIFKVILGIVGFFLGGAMAITAGNLIPQNELILFVMGFIGGVVGAVMMVWLYFIGVFFIGAMMGGIIGTTLFAAVQIYPGELTLFIFSICFGLLALIFQKFMIIIATAFVGSWHMVVGIACLIGGKGCMTNMEWLFKLGSSHNYIITLMWLFFSFLGFFVQCKLASDKGSDPKY